MCERDEARHRVNELESREIDYEIKLADARAKVEKLREALRGVMPYVNAGECSPAFGQAHALERNLAAYRAAARKAWEALGE